MMVVKILIIYFMLSLVLTAPAEAHQPTNYKVYITFPTGQLPSTSSCQTLVDLFDATYFPTSEPSLDLKQHAALNSFRSAISELFDSKTFVLSEQEKIEFHAQNEPETQIENLELDALEYCRDHHSEPVSQAALAALRHDFGHA